VAAERKQASPEEFAAAAMEFAVSHEADQAGIAAMDPMYVFEGYTIEEPWVIMLALAHNYERLRQVPHRAWPPQVWLSGCSPLAAAARMESSRSREISTVCLPLRVTLNMGLREG